MAPYKKKRVWNFSVDVTVPATATGGARKRLRAIHDNVRKHAVEQRKTVVDTLSGRLQRGIEVRAAYAWQVLRHIPALSKEERLQRSAAVRAALEENDHLRRRLELQLAQVSKDKDAFAEMQPSLETKRGPHVRSLEEWRKRKRRRREETNQNETVIQEYITGINADHVLCSEFENHSSLTTDGPIERDASSSRALVLEEKIGEARNQLPDIVDVGSPTQTSAYAVARERLIGEYLDDRRVLKALILRTENMLSFFARHMV